MAKKKNQPTPISNTKFHHPTWKTLLWQVFVPFLTGEAFSEAGLLDMVVPIQTPPFGPGLSILQLPGMEASGSS